MMPNRKNIANLKQFTILLLGLVLVSSAVPLQSIYAANVSVPSTPTNLSDFATTNSETPDIFSSGDPTHPNANFGSQFFEGTDILTRFNKTTEVKNNKLWLE